MPSDAEKRVENWNTKFNTGRVKETLDALRDDMLAHYQAAVAQLCAMETEVKQTLDKSGVHTILYVPYLDYGRQLYKLSRQKNISGESFAMAAQVLLEKWQSRGLDPAVLAAIRSEVFNVSAP